MLVLHVIQGPERGRRFQLPDDEPQLIGRSSEALPIADQTMSRRHAELTPDDGRWFLRDLDSANGTWVNGERIHDRILLAAGDQIRCGSTLFLFASTPDGRRSSPIRVLGPDELDATVERTLESSASVFDDDSVILSTPDPAAAAVHHLRIVYDLTALTATVTDREQLLNRVMDLVFDEFQPDRGFVLLQHDPAARPDPVVIRYKTPPKTLDEGHIPVSRTIVQHTLRKGQGVLSSNAMHDTRFQSGDSVQRYGIRSALCVPIQSGPRVFGVIHIDSSVANFTYTEDQLRLMTLIGQHTGLALTTMELIQSKMRTERLAAIGETVATLSHSIKNILQGLRGGADAVQLALNRDDLKLAREGWPIVARNLDRIYSLTLNMLAYSTQRSPDVELVSLQKLIEEAVELIQPQCDRKRVALLQDMDESMPPIPLDPGAIHQALMNLLTNAVEAAPERNGAVSIRTRYREAEQVAEIAISDTGPGIPSEVRVTVFEPFRTTKGQRGTGLGLAVTRKIVEEHGGRVELLETPRDEDAPESPQAGSTFVITLPVDVTPGDSSETKLPRPIIGDGDW